MHTNRATAKHYINDTLGYLIEHTHSQGINKGQNYPTGTKVSWVLNLQLSFCDLKKIGLYGIITNKQLKPVTFYFSINDNNNKNYDKRYPPLTYQSSFYDFFSFGIEVEISP